MKKDLILNKKTLSILYVLIILVIIGYIFFNNRYNYNNLKLYNNYSGKKTVIPLSKEEKNNIINYLKKEKFNENKLITKCISKAAYELDFDIYELHIDKDFCSEISMYNKKTKESKKIIISKEFINYIKKIDNN